MKKFGKILWGLVFIIVGVILGSNAFGLTNINIFFDGWWTLFIIVPCFIGVFTEDDKTGNFIGLLIGIGLLLACLDILEFDILWKLLIPVILVMIGLSIIFKDVIGSSISKEIKKLNKDSKDKQEYCAAFSGKDLRFDNEEFLGANIEAIFGGVKCDLRNAKIEKDQVINASAIFGGIDIYVPEDVNVKVNSTSIFGGVTDKEKRNNSDKTIYINATCIFGGVEIK